MICRVAPQTVLNWASSVTHDGTGYCGVGGGLGIGWGSAWAPPAGTVYGGGVGGRGTGGGAPGPPPAPTRAKAIAAPATVTGTVFLIMLAIPYMELVEEPRPVRFSCPDIEGRR